jgi:hypothetical protein
VTAWIRARPALLAGAVAALPLVVVAVVLLWRPWVPVLDMAMTELRVRDVGGRHTPLIGLPGRIGTFPDQGSHPGPWSFWLVAPIYRLAGSTAWGMELASVVINSACLIVLAWLGHRRLRWPGGLAFAALGAVVVRGYGLTVLTHPWNPYFPVLLWLVALVAAWGVLSADHWLAPLVTTTSVIAAQTHVPYLLSAIAVNGLVVGVLAWRWRRPASPASPASTVGAGRPLLTTLALASLLWVPPVVEQLRTGRENGNLSRLVRHFATEQPEPTIGLRPAFELVTQHFDLFSLVPDLVVRQDALVHRAGQAGSISIGGTVVLLLWVAAAGWAVSRRHRQLMTLHTVVGLTTVIGWISISRIFGKVWFYLTLWMSASALLAGVGVLWTAWIIVRERRPSAALTTRQLLGAVVGIGAIASVLSIGAAFVHQPPEHEFGDDVAAIVPDVVAAIADGTGAAVGSHGTYIVFWEEALVPGSQGLALLDELERRGIDVGVHPTWRVPATAHRVLRPGENDAEVHLVTGGWIEGWRELGFVEVVTYDGRSDEERARFEDLASDVDARLVEIGRAELAGQVDENMFRVSLEPGLPDDVVDDLDEMLHIGVPMSVFIAPAGSTF